PVEEVNRGYTFVRGWTSTLYPNFYAFEADNGFGQKYTFTGYFPFAVDTQPAFSVRAATTAEQTSIDEADALTATREQRINDFLEAIANG
ncbi:MAG: hypothetical protein L7U46_00810, partial [Candidatus Nanopelagicales bacterium]|nr:hypothetical protein [Candidatus Nanopelagicales bacterium]